MRTAVVLLVALCACESRYGAYFNVDGDSNSIRFDRVELYFGKNGMSGSNIGKPSGPTMGKVFERDFDASDAWDVARNGDGSLATESTYWLPANEHNRGLGYVAAIAYDTTSSRDKPVGVGELIDFTLDTEVVDKYDIELQNPGFGVDTWGSNQGCFAWTRQRDGQFSTIAVLSPDDADCDGIVAGADCNDLCPVGAGTCLPDATVCGSLDHCGLGCVHSGSCAIETCLPNLACGSTCGGKLPTLEERMTCVAMQSDPHLTINLFLTGGRPCTRQLTVPVYGRACTNPTVIWRQRFFDGWTIDVKPSPANPTYCEITLTNSNTAATFTGDHHVLVAFPPIPPAVSQWTVLLGVRDQSGICGAPGYEIDQLAGTPSDCP